MGGAACRRLFAFSILRSVAAAEAPDSCTGGQCDAPVAVNSGVLSRPVWPPFLTLPLAKATVGNFIASFIAGELAQVRDWKPCNITGEGSQPGTFNIVTPGVQGEVRDVPAEGLRLVEVPALEFSVGDSAEVYGWSRCSILARAAAPQTYDVRKGHKVLRSVPALRLRKIPQPGWLHTEDPAVASGVPGQDAGGICKGADGCGKVWSACVAQRRKMAEQNCGGRCDIIFVGDSLLETMLGRACFSGGRSFQESRQVYQELLGSRKALILAGSGDETSHTLHMLDKALPVLRAPKLYFVLVGTNNIPKGGGANALRGIRAVIDRLHAQHPHVTVLLHTLLPRADDRDHRVYQAHIDEVNAELPRMANSDKDQLVDCRGVLQAPWSSAKHFYDKLHLSAAGYAAWLRCVLPALDRALAKAGE